MSTNIVFESNIYPVYGRIHEDKEFLSKIWDYNRLRAIDRKHYSNVQWSDLQQRIIREQPACSLNKEDPCWGMVKTINGYRWVSMCTKTECPRFASCRSKIPYDRDNEAEFVPLIDSVDEYGYKKFIAEYSPAPLLIGDDVEYDCNVNTQAPNKPDEADGEFFSPFKQLMREKEISTREEENQPKEESDSIDEEVENQNTEKLEKEIEIEDSVPADVGAPSVDIHSPSLNVFEHFSECSQDEIIKAPFNENFFVDAGPGTGKTYTLIQKLNYMVTREGVEADGILVLCFTNAAVDEIKGRLRKFVKDGADRSLVNVDIRTFHSFAWWLINQANSVLTDSGWNSIELQGLSYEMSLIKATEIVKKFGENVVRNWEYFVVDEVQDLTNSLGWFVLEIVRACLSVNCGVTVLGDACQAIYDYNQETYGTKLKSGEFYKVLFRILYMKARFVYLTENHRQSSDLINLISGLREAILSADSIKMSQVVGEFEDRVEKALCTETTVDNTFLNKTRKDGSVSLLFRNNGQTLKMSSDLRKRGIPHTLNITETKNNFAPWITEVFGDYTRKTISEDNFKNLYEDATGQDGDEIWRRLQHLLHTDNDLLNTRELLDAVALSRIDDSLLRASRDENVVVSNIHRSKGREYDCVIVDKSFVDEFSEVTSIDEYKILYVAITRPKKKLLLAPLQKKSEMTTIQIYATGRKRWGKKKNKKIVYLELDGVKDINCEMYAHVSNELFENIQIGDAVFLKRNLKDRQISYSIIHEDTECVLGTMDMQCPYVQDYISYMKCDSGSFIEMPSSINDLYVSGIYSQVVDSQYLELHPEIKATAPNGVWKWIELVGIGHADYDVY